MSCASESKAESPCCCDGKADYYEVFRKASLAGSVTLVSQMIAVESANALEVDATNLAQNGAYNVLVGVEYGNNAENWTRTGLTPSVTFTAPGYQAGVLSAVSAKFVRVVLFGSGAGRARLSAGIRLRTETPKLIPAAGPILPGLEAAGPGQDADYFLLADRLYVPLGSPVTLAPVSMADRNAARLEFVVIQPTGIPISANVEGSNDAQSWQTLQNYSGIPFGYSSPAALTGISHRFIRVKVNGAQAFFSSIVELGLTLSRQ